MSDLERMLLFFVAGLVIGRFVFMARSIPGEIIRWLKSRKDR